MVLVLYETAAGFALFKVKDEGKMANVEVSSLHSFVLSLLILKALKVFMDYFLFFFAGFV